MHAGDAAVVADDEHVRDGLDAVLVADLALGVVDVVQWRGLAAAGDGGEIGARFLQVHRVDLQRVMPDDLLQLAQDRQFLAARAAPRGPERDDDDLAALAGQVHHIALAVLAQDLRRDIAGSR